jgi:hypothetical protein
MKAKSSFLILSLSAVLATAASAQVHVYVSPNDIQTAEDSGIIGVTDDQIFTEDFSSRPANSSINGYTSAATGVTYTTDNGGKVQENDQYGGYDSGNYLGVPATRSTTLTLATAAQYFGFYFTAGDANNLIKIYSGNTLLLSFSTQSLIDMLPNTAGSKITAINGDKYSTVNYYGQPVSNLNGNEPYAYLHFVTDGTQTFDRIVLSQQGSAAIFESDNHSILTVAPTIPDSLVAVPYEVPEGGPGALALSVLAGSLGFVRKKRSL